jgi:hydrogenase maturation protease
MAEKNARKPVLVLGIGNVLLADEGIGIHVIEELQKIPLPENVEIADGGTSGADLIDILAEREKVIIVDSVQTDDKAGTIRKFTLDNLWNTSNNAVSLHNVGISETIRMTEILGCKPGEVIFLGIKPEIVSCGLKLSKNLSRKISKIIESILTEINSASCCDSTSGFMQKS